MKHFFRLTVVLIVWILILPNMIFAANPSPITRLDDLIDQTLRLVAIGKNEDAEKLLAQFEKEFKLYSSQNKQLTEEEYQIIAEAQKDSIDVFNQSSESKVLHNKVTSLRLAVDALEDSDKPMWLEMQEPIDKTFSKIDKAISDKDYEEYNRYFNLLLTQYQKIVPAMKLDVEKSRFQSVDEKVKSIETYRRQIFLDEDSKKMMIDLQTEMDGVFRTVLIESSEPSLLWVISTTGGIILVTLTYVGWRKYRAEMNFSKKIKKIS